jgi:uncharacterized hydrophobic protein (TIGR00271 family)
MLSVSTEDIARMRDNLFFEGPEATRKTTRFWVLLLLAAIIAAAGVTGDSTATVIGAMIVAPLMTPILGIALAIVLADRANLARCLLLVVAGSIMVIGLAWLMGHAVPYDVVAPANSQVAGRISPRVIDLIAALATGAVGAVALARSDISDTLPGVAIAISLVPPLSVVGLTLEAGATDQARGALLLFVTNVSAILAMGVVVLAVYRVHQRAAETDPPAGPMVGTWSRRGAIVAIVALVVIVLVPLAATSQSLARRTLDVNSVREVADPWARSAGWAIVSIAPGHDGIVVRATGPLPEPPTGDLRAQLDAKGLRGTTVHVELVPGRVVDLPGE